MFAVESVSGLGVVEALVRGIESGVQAIARDAAAKKEPTP